MKYTYRFETQFFYQDELLKKVSKAMQGFFDDMEAIGLGGPGPYSITITAQKKLTEADLTKIQKFVQKQLNKFFQEKSNKMKDDSEISIKVLPAKFIKSTK